MLKAVINNPSEVEAHLRSLYVESSNAPTAGRWILHVEHVDGVGLGNLRGLGETAERWQGRATKAIVNDKISAALDAAGVDPAWRDDFAETLLGSIRLREDGEDVTVEVVDEQGIQRIGRGGAWMGVEDAVSDLRDRHPRCFNHGSASQASAGTSPASPAAPFTGKSPFSKEHWNLSRQGELYRTDRPLYDRLKAEADRAAAPAEHGNPFHRETFNLTRQMMLIRSDPTRAEVLRAEAVA
ncbi:hypothetical protein [Bradyrhizobium sp. P5_C11_2]